MKYEAGEGNDMERRTFLRSLMALPLACIPKQKLWNVTSRLVVHPGDVRVDPRLTDSDAWYLAPPD